MPLAIYDAPGGPIKRIVTCAARFAEQQAKPGEAFIEVGPDVDDTTHEVVDGEIVAL